MTRVSLFLNELVWSRKIVSVGGLVLKNVTGKAGNSFRESFTNTDNLYFMSTVSESVLAYRNEFCVTTLFSYDGIRNSHKNCRDCESVNDSINEKFVTNSEGLSFESFSQYPFSPTFMICTYELNDFASFSPLTFNIQFHLHFVRD